MPLWTTPSTSPNPLLHLLSLPTPHPRTPFSSPGGLLIIKGLPLHFLMGSLPKEDTPSFPEGLSSPSKDSPLPCFPDGLRTLLTYRLLNLFQTTPNFFHPLLSFPSHPLPRHMYIDSLELYLFCTVYWIRLQSVCLSLICTDFRFTYWVKCTYSWQSENINKKHQLENEIWISL